MNDPTSQVPADWFRDPEYCAQLGRKSIGLRELDVLVQGPDSQAKADRIAEAYQKYTNETTPLC